MSAVWRAARAAVRRRKLQTTVLGLVVFSSTVTVIVALGLLVAASAPFDQAFDRQRGAHVTAVFDAATVSASQLEETQTRPGVEAAAGPFEQAVLTVPDSTDAAGSTPPPVLPPGPLTVAGRADPEGPVDQVNVWSGRWATKPGEIVLDRDRAPGVEEELGATVTFTNGATLTIVGFGSSLGQSAEAWVAPEQMDELGPTALQVLYRFDRAGTQRQVSQSLDAVTADLPEDSLLGAPSYLALKEDFGRTAAAYLPFLIGFGILGLAVAALIVANVVSGAVVSGLRHIGVLKAMGFTPNQVVAAYLTMVLVPAVTGSVLGAVVGGLAAQPLLQSIFHGVGTLDLAVGLSSWVYAVTLLGMPAVVVLAALVPALRAHRLSAARAISAGSAPRPGRGQRVQRLLAGARLPRPVSLGLGLPLARPGRSVLTLAAVVLGVVSVTLAAGLSSTMTAYGDASQRAGHVHTVVYAGLPQPGKPAPKYDDAETEALLRSLPGTVHVTADAWIEVYLAGDPQSIMGQFYRGDSETLGDTIVEGRWLQNPGEVVATSPFLDKRNLEIGDQLTLSLNGNQTPVTIVGATMDGDADLVKSNWETLTTLAPDQKATQYEVQLAPGTDVSAYNAAVKDADPDLSPRARSQVNSDSVIIMSAASVLTVLLGTVAALGVFNTVVLNTRERRRDLGMLKSIGMTPWQVTVMVVTSMAALGAIGGVLGLPLGIGAHRLVVPAMADSAGITLPESMINVWDAGALALLCLAGVVIAVLGALVPARSAGRLTIAKVLHNE